jgi:uncharacterized membrane protein YvbJ
VTGWLCDRCGSTNDSASDFCARCGADGQAAKRQSQPAVASAWAASLRPGETIEQAYLRQTRNAAVFIAWIVGIIFAVILILGIIVAKDLSTASNASPSPTCLSQGGYDPSC